MAQLEVVIWNVKHGSAAFVRTPNDRTLMLDAGCSDSFSPAKHLATKYGLSRNGKRLDWLLVSHPDQDHILDLPNVHQALHPRILHRNSTIPDGLTYPSGKSNLSEPLRTYEEMNRTYNQPLGDSDKAAPVSN